MKLKAGKIKELEEDFKEVLYGKLNVVNGREYLDLSHLGTYDFEDKDYEKKDESAMGKLDDLLTEQVDSIITAQEFISDQSACAAFIENAKSGVDFLLSSYALSEHCVDRDWTVMDFIEGLFHGVRMDFMESVEFSEDDFE